MITIMFKRFDLQWKLFQQMPVAFTDWRLSPELGYITMFKAQDTWAWLRDYAKVMLRPRGPGSGGGGGVANGLHYLNFHKLKSVPFSSTH
jgi:hypothetical protein